FQLRDHASELEKLAIASHYHLDVTGELYKAAQTYQEMIETYPRDSLGYQNLAVVYASKGTMRSLLRWQPKLSASFPTWWGARVFGPRGWSITFGTGRTLPALPQRTSDGVPDTMASPTRRADAGLNQLFGGSDRIRSGL